MLALVLAAAPAVHAERARLRDRDERVERAIQEAARRLAQPGCAALLDYYGLAAPVQPLPDYVSSLLYIEVGTGGACRHRVPRPIAVTTVGGRVVGVCRPGLFTWPVVIHETLHTLGLGENPPTPQSITYQVEQVCGGRPR